MKLKCLIRGDDTWNVFSLENWKVDEVILFGMKLIFEENVDYLSKVCNKMISLFFISFSFLKNHPAIIANKYSKLKFLFN